MQHPIDIYTEVQVLVESCKTCGGIKRYNSITANIVSYEMVNNEFMYSLSSGHVVPQRDIQQIVG